MITGWFVSLKLGWRKWQGKKQTKKPCTKIVHATRIAVENHPCHITLAAQTEHKAEAEDASTERKRTQASVIMSHTFFRKGRDVSAGHASPSYCQSF